MKKAIEVCGTSSGVGKSVITAGLCRIFLQDGLRVAPFKAQNMSLNSFVTPEGGEIGRAQAMQAEACRLKPSSDMNPILLKPTSDRGAQVVVRGKPVGNMSAIEYQSYKGKARIAVSASFNRLKKDHDIVVIEGAGSPAEINLKAHDIVNMKMALAADAPVILVGDIDRGGVFAHLVGTLELLTKREREQVKGFIINKFRGDKRLLGSGIRFLEKRTGIRVLGVVPYFKDIRLPEEDSVVLDERRATSDERRATRSLDIAVIKLPHISNFTDFDALEAEPDVHLRYINRPDELGSPDVIIIPGTKNTIGDLQWLKQSGLADKILYAIRYSLSANLIGICGGYQMLGKRISDPHGIESKRKNIDALGLLPVVTTLGRRKTLTQVSALEAETGLEVSGYEIHHGRTVNLKPSKRVFEIMGRKRRDGNISGDGRIWGTYIHGVFDSDAFRRNFLNRVRAGRGLRPIESRASCDLNKELDKLAELLRANLDIDAVYKILTMNHEP